MARPRFCLLIMGLLIILSPAAVAQGTSPPDSDTDLRRYRFSELRKMRVEDAGGEAVARVYDLVLDRSTGKVRYTLLSFGGHLGVGRVFKLAPAPALSTETAKKGVLALPLTRQQLQRFPEFRRQDMPRLENPGHQLALLDLYGFPQPAPTSAITRSGRISLELATELVGRAVLTPDHQKIGNISDLLVDLSGQRPGLAICSKRSVLKRAQRYAVLVGALATDEHQNEVIQKATGPLEQAPWFNKTRWQPSSGQTRLVLFRYDDTPPSNSVHDAKDLEQDTPTPLGQSQATTDLQTTARIRRAISNDTNLSLTAKNIKVITVNGRVTLRGPVRSVGEKEEIARIAGQTAGSSNVVNQLEPAR